MLIGNSWDTSCGEFLCGYSGMITHGLHQNAVLEKKAHAGSPRLRDNSPESQKHVFTGGFAFLHSLLSHAGPWTLKSYRKNLGVLLALSTEFDFPLGEKTAHRASERHLPPGQCAVPTSILRGWGVRWVETRSRAKNWPGSWLYNDVRLCGDKASFCPQGLNIHFDLLWAASPPCSVCSVAWPTDLSLRGGPMP